MAEMTREQHMERFIQVTPENLSLSDFNELDGQQRWTAFDCLRGKLFAARTMHSTSLEAFKAERAKYERELRLERAWRTRAIAGFVDLGSQVARLVFFCACTMAAAAGVALLVFAGVYPLRLLEIV